VGLVSSSSGSLLGGDRGDEGDELTSRFVISITIYEEVRIRFNEFFFLNNTYLKNRFRDSFLVDDNELDWRRIHPKGSVERQSSSKKESGT
jgi:hypothetical protein